MIGFSHHTGFNTCHDNSHLILNGDIKIDLKILVGAANAYIRFLHVFQSGRKITRNSVTHLAENRRLNIAMKDINIFI